MYTGAKFTQECHPEYESNNGYVKAMEATVRALAEGYRVKVERPPDVLEREAAAEAKLLAAWGETPPEVD